jgi:hypothetical protein
MRTIYKRPSSSICETIIIRTYLCMYMYIGTYFYIAFEASSLVTLPKTL